MSTRRILTIFRRDFRDAVRDARVLLMILVPFGIGVLYNFMFADESTRPNATVVYASSGQTVLPATMQRIADPVADVTIRELASPELVRSEVEDDDAELGLVIPVGFDAAVASGAAPELTIYQTDTQDFGGDYLLATIEPALRQMAGQSEPATVRVETIGDASDDTIVERLGLREYFVLAAIILQVAMIALLAMPSVLAVEAEQRTLDALVMIASYREVIIAKALWGLVYIGISVALLAAVTGLVPDDPVSFVAGLGLLSIALVGFGLLLGGWLTANQLNSWGGVLMLPAVAPAFIIGTPAPEALKIAANLLPTAQGARLAMNGLAGETVFANPWLSVLGLLAWAVVGFALLSWRLARREA
jgi:ABC-type multidrug transport system permease subunit